MPRSSQTAAYVGMIGDFPIAVAVELETVKSKLESDQLRYGSRGDYDYRWDEYRPGKVWRLMQRRKGPEGKGRRFSWTTYSVHTVDLLDGAR
ncbi:hypothetical protein ACFVOB_28110 [Streptomyces rochei]|uniref:hypothetical protein n=1 Tax=Streptomyces rochei TaxID=1928 RepID=UPI0035313624